MDDVGLIKSLIDMVNELSYRDEERLDALRRRAKMVIKKVFGDSSDYIQDLGNIGFFPRSISTHFNKNLEPYRVRNEKYEKELWNSGKAKMLNLFSTMLEDRKLRNKSIVRETSIILKIIDLAEHKLRKVIRDEPEREADIQDAFENLLIAADISVLREKENIPYSSKTYIPDFTFGENDLAIDIKFCYNERRERQIIKELNDYIMAFQTKYNYLLFIVYDLGFIRDIDRFKEEFEKNHNVTVKVIKH